MRSVTDLPGGGTRTVPRPGRSTRVPPPSSLPPAAAAAVARQWPVEWTEVDFAVGESSRNLRLTGLRTLSDPAIAIRIRSYRPLGICEEQGEGDAIESRACVAMRIESKGESCFECV